MVLGSSIYQSEIFFKWLKVFNNNICRIMLRKALAMSDNTGSFSEYCFEGMVLSFGIIVV